jgi:hypothetical protein
MSAKFTKGPWRVDNSCSTVLMISAGSWPVCEVNGYGLGINQDAVDSANANLIAAAPDMYEMLKDILHNYEAGEIVDVEIEIILKRARGE